MTAATTTIAPNGPGRRPSRPRLFTELGEEVQCSLCGEFWPADEEFFYFSHGRPHSYCRSCYLTHPSVAEKRLRDAERKRQARGAAESATC